MNGVNSNFLFSSFSLVGLWYLVVKLHRYHRVESFRQETFAIRDELFDFAADGEISFDDPAYGQLRNAMNGFLRFAHRLSILQCLLFYIVNRKELALVNGFEERWQKNCGELPKPTREKLEAFRTRVHTAVLKHLILSSPVSVLTLIIPILVYSVGHHCIHQLLKLLRQPLEEMDAAAVAIGGGLAEYNIGFKSAESCARA